MSAAICWMLYGWLPPTWALLGSLVVSLRFGLLDYWGQSYWGGAIAAAGGALLFGGARRVLSHPRRRDAMLMALGAAILANSRPFEGLLASAPTAVLFVFRFVRGTAPSRRTLVTHVVVPAAIVALLTIAAMGYYNLRVTGDAFRMPYAVHAATYRMEPIFLFKTPSPDPGYRHMALRNFHAGFEMETYRDQHPIGGRGFLVTKRDQVSKLWRFYLGPILTIPLVLLPWMIRDIWIRVALVTCGLLGLGLALETWAFEHYAAPVLSLVVLLVLQALRTWQTRDKQVGIWVTSLLALGTVTYFAITLVTQVRADPEDTWFRRRAAVLARLATSGERHLIIVRYAADHPVHNEWVYNGADIDGSAVVWARYVDPASNQQLIRYFQGRRVWLFDVGADDGLAGLRPYTQD